MACCILAAFVISRILRTCQCLDILSVSSATGSSAGWPSSAEHTPQYATAKISINGMTCSACSAKIEDAIGQLNGVARVTVALPFNQATVAYDETKMTPTDLINAIEELGYEAQPGRRSIQESLKIMQHEDDLQRLQKSFSGVLTYSLLLASTNMLASYSYLATTTTHEYRFKWTIPLIALALFLRIQHRHASHIHHAASRALRTGQTTMDTLTSATQAISLISSLSNLLLLGPSAPTHFTTAALLLLVVLFGRYVDLHLRRNAMSTLTSLFRLQSDLAHVRVRQKRRRDKDAEEVLPAALLRPGDEMVIEPFDSVPCDAYVLDGESLLDMSVITGESLPVAKSAGDFILSGSRNSHGRLLAAVVKGQEESTLAAMLDGVVEAAGRKADVEGTFGGLVRIFVAVIIGLATASAMVEHARAKSGMSEAHAMNKAAQRAMAVLAAACPCALGLAIPSAMLAFLGKNIPGDTFYFGRPPDIFSPDAASSQGVLLTGGAQSIEALTDITHVVLDKTGTLTQGRLQVTACKLFHPLPVERRVFLQLLCAAEVTEAEAHPIAKAVFAWAVKELRAVGYRPISDEHVFERRAVPGSGVECVVGTGGNTSHQVVVGNANFLVSHGVEVCMKEEGRWAEDYGITIHIAVDAQYVAQLRLSDTPRLEATEVVQKLKRDGYQLTMLTGDSETEARRISEMLNIPVMASGALPTDKRAFVMGLQAEGNKVVMVGDGLNDAPPLAAADVGIQLSLPRQGATGAGDVLFMRQDLRYLPRIIGMARCTTRQARFNVLWALAYNTLALLFAMGVFEPWGWTASASITGSMMAASSIAILISSLFLRSRLATQIAKI